MGVSTSVPAAASPPFRIKVNAVHAGLFQLLPQPRHPTAKLTPPSTSSPSNSSLTASSSASVATVVMPLLPSTTTRNTLLCPRPPTHTPPLTAPALHPTATTLVSRPPASPASLLTHLIP